MGRHDQAFANDRIGTVTIGDGEFIVSRRRFYRQDVYAGASYFAVAEGVDERSNVDDGRRAPC